MCYCSNFRQTVEKKKWQEFRSNQDLLELINNRMFIEDSRKASLLGTWHGVQRVERLVPSLQQHASHSFRIPNLHSLNIAEKKKNNNKKNKKLNITPLSQTYCIHPVVKPSVNTRSIPQLHHSLRWFNQCRAANKYRGVIISTAMWIQERAS